MITSVLNPALCQVVCAFIIFTPKKSGTVARQGVAVAVGVGVGVTVGEGDGVGVRVGVGVGAGDPGTT